MTEETFLEQFREFDRRDPFRPCAIELRDGKRLEITRPNSLLGRDGTYHVMRKSILPEHTFDVADVIRFVETDKPPILTMTPMEKRLRHRLKRLGKEALQTLTDALEEAASDEKVDWADVESRVRDLHAELAIVADLIGNYRRETEGGAK